MINYQNEILKIIIMIVGSFLSLGIKHFLFSEINKKSRILYIIFWVINSVFISYMLFPIILFYFDCFQSIELQILFFLCLLSTLSLDILIKFIKKLNLIKITYSIINKYLGTKINDD